MNALKKNEIYEAEIVAYSSEALGICRIDGQAVFVPGTIKGERWRVRIVKVSSECVYGRGEELLRASDERIEPQCRFFRQCGGCDAWHISYAEELRFKLDKVNGALAHIGRQTVMADTILGSESITRYRNKGIFAAAEIEGCPSFGFFKARSHELVSIDDCLIQNKLSVDAAKAVTEFVRDNAIPCYDEATGKGYLRHIFCRKAVNTDDAVLCIVSARGFGSKTAALVAYIREKCPELSGIVLNINKSRGNSVLNGDFYTLWGRDKLSDILCGFRFDLAPQAFFQINPQQAEKLYTKAVEYALPLRGGTVLELYCGAGTISLCLSRLADKVIGAEIVPQAIENAAGNAIANGVQNVEFICADAGKAAQEVLEKRLKIDAVLVDPPRKGMDIPAIDAVASIKPERITYVSCNPATMARDILLFNARGYKLSNVTAVDMFPRTCHVESVCLLTRESD